MKKVFALLLLVLSFVLTACSSSTLGKEVEIQENVSMTVSEVKYQNGWLYVTVSVDGSDLSGVPTLLPHNFSVEDSEGDFLEYSQLEYGENSFETTSWTQDNPFTSVVSVEGKGEFILIFKSEKDKLPWYKISYEIEGETFTWRS